MRYGIAAVLGVTSGAAMILVGPLAGAAAGDLIINRIPYRNPDGCLEVAGKAMPLAVENNTATGAAVFRDSGCTGEMTGYIDPFNTRRPGPAPAGFFGASIKVMR
ncbi:hypothetical protein [Nocardia sp. NPDC052566]|uniref:hypothetical protein n=1 Tax=Nocardia sp. NPDC052566 TaxID=3364330 RepID=UPI0037C6CE41